MLTENKMMGMICNITNSLEANPGGNEIYSECGDILRILMG